MTHNPNIEELAQRVDSLESEVETLRDLTTATDENGKQWTASKLITELGLTRRQAIVVIGMLASGSTLIGALTRTTSAQSASDASGPVYFDQIGDPDNPVSDFYVANEYQAASDQNPVFDSVTTGSIDVDTTQNASASIYQTNGGAPDPSSITIEEIKLGDVVVGSIEMDLSGSPSLDQRWVISVNNSYISDADSITGSAFVYGSVTNNNLAYFQIERQPFNDRLIIICTRVSGSADYSGGLSGSYVLF